MGRSSTRTRTYSAVAVAAITSLVLGIFNPFPIGVLLFGTGLLLPIGNERVAFSFSVELPKHPRVVRQQQQSKSSSKSKSKCGLWDRNNNNDDVLETNQSEQPQEQNFAPTKNRRRFLRDQFVGTLSATSAASATLLWASNPKAASAGNPKSRTDGYAVQRTEREWAYMLSGAQYNILRSGGTERQKSSILNTFTAADHVGTYTCAGCKTALFASESKFSSGTGWPSFADIVGSNVEAEAVNPIAATLGGREVRCGTCGGHLGDLFNDGFIYVGTPAFQTGKRYCIDGAALIFQPSGEGEEIFGDVPPPNKPISYEQTMFRDKSINGGR